MSLDFRQVHLDFHTSEAIPSVGEEFSREQFQEALKLGHVNSITLFAKGHHGWSYYPSEVNDMHPHLSFDLLGSQIEACREIGVRTPIYISAGLDEKEAVRHPEWLKKPCPDSGADFVHQAGYHPLCYNTPYMDQLEAQIEEVMRLFSPVEIFLDISSVSPCYCSHCLASMRQHGLCPDNPYDAWKMAEIVYETYCQRVERAVRKYRSDTRIFHNGGNIRRGRRDLVAYDSHHLELESLPTGGWGYDHFPMSAAYARTLQKDFLGMTGKFHTTWGEFGGFKHPNALRYETALSLAAGAACSVGDQLHPSGRMNLSTYRLIGQAFGEVERKEPWCRGAEAMSEVGVLSSEAFESDRIKRGLNRNNPSDTGASRILSEGKYLYDILDEESDFTPYRLLILPDTIRLNPSLTTRLNAYLENGGKILASGESGLLQESDRFAVDFGVDCIGKNPFCPTYLIPSPELSLTNGVTEYVMYEEAFDLSVRNGTVAACLTEPYFNRTPEHFSSHQHTPNRPMEGKPAAVVTDNTVYIGWKVFADYGKKGELHVKELVTALIDLLIGGTKRLYVDLPDRALTFLNAQKAQNRWIHHLLFAYTSVRGNGIEVIEDTVPLYRTACRVRSNRCPVRVYLAPQEEDLPFTYTDGCIAYTVPCVDIHQMVVMEFSPDQETI